MPLLRRVVPQHARLAVALLYNTYYMISSIFNDKCAIFLIFIALMCASGFNNWCCRMVTSQNYPAKLLCFQPSLAQVVNHETRVAINLAPSPCSSEMPTCNDSEDTPWQKSLPAAFLPFPARPAPEEEAGRVQQPPGPGGGCLEPPALLACGAGSAARLCPHSRFTPPARASCSD